VILEDGEMDDGDWPLIHSTSGVRWKATNIDRRTSSVLGTAPSVEAAKRCARDAARFIESSQAIRRKAVRP
jgi:hypothetical protein